MIWQGKELPAANYNIIGASGEEEVLIFLIRHFLQIKEIERRKHALSEVHALVLKHVAKDKETIQRHSEFYSACLQHIGNDAELAKALIPLFYVTIHYQFAYLDMVAWYDNRAILVEVKSTQSPRNNSFKLSASEINEARQHENYMLVRVTPTSVLMMGNPIFSISEDLKRIKRDNYIIQPHGYTFEFLDQNSIVNA